MERLACLCKSLIKLGYITLDLERNTFHQKSSKEHCQYFSNARRWDNFELSPNPKRFVDISKISCVGQHPARRIGQASATHHKRSGAT